MPKQLRAYAGAYCWPDRRVDVTEAAQGLLVSEDGITKEALPLDRRTFLLDSENPDAATISFDDSTRRAGRACSTTWCGASGAFGTSKGNGHGMDPDVNAVRLLFDLEGLCMVCGRPGGSPARQRSAKPNSHR